MDMWQRARTFAEDAAKRSQELTKGAAKRSQEFTMEAARRSQFSIGSSKLSEIVSEASKRSKEIANEASKRADLLKVEALKRADQIKAQIPAAALSHLVDSGSASAPENAVKPEDLEEFGVSDELREFVKDISLNTFKDFPLEDDSEMSDIPTVSNVCQDLTKWQEVHAKLVLSTVKEISKLRYEKRYMEDAKKKSAEEVKKSSRVGTDSKTEVGGVSQKSKSVSSSATEQDLDVFLLGDLGDSDDTPDDGGDEFDGDFDKL